MKIGLFIAKIKIKINQIGIRNVFLYTTSLGIFQNNFT